VHRALKKLIFEATRQWVQFVGWPWISSSAVGLINARRIGKWSSPGCRLFFLGVGVGGDIATGLWATLDMAENSEYSSGRQTINL